MINIDQDLCEITLQDFLFYGIKFDFHSKEIEEIEEIVEIPT